MCIKCIFKYSGDLNTNIWISLYDIWNSDASFLLLTGQVDEFSDIQINICITDFRSRYSEPHSNNRSFNDQTNLDHLNTRLARHSDPYCSMNVLQDTNKVILVPVDVPRNGRPLKFPIQNWLSHRVSRNEAPFQKVGQPLGPPGCGHGLWTGVLRVVCPSCCR